MEYAAAVDVLRVTVNAGGSTGSAGFDTGLAPSMTIGTGFTGRSSLGENLEPRHLLNHARIAYNTDVREVFPDYHGIEPWVVPPAATPPYPRASNAADAPALVPVSAVPTGVSTGQEPAELREELRRLIIEELNAIVRG